MADIHTRKAMLRDIFSIFDSEDDGTVEAGDLASLANSRGDWDEQRVSDVIRKLDLVSDGEVSSIEFAQFFEEALPQDMCEFKRIHACFTEVAKSFRERREQFKQDFEAAWAAREAEQVAESREVEEEDADFNKRRGFAAIRRAAEVCQ